MPHASVTRAIAPPSASISLTRCPLPTPPTAGLHDICASLSRSPVSISVRRPRRAAASAASQPAWPAPTTITSYASGCASMLLLTISRHQVATGIAANDLPTARGEQGAEWFQRCRIIAASREELAIGGVAGDELTGGDAHRRARLVAGDDGAFFGAIAICGAVAAGQAGGDVGGRDAGGLGRAAVAADLAAE